MSYFKDLNPYQVHQKLINDYVLKRPGDTSKLYARDTSKDKTDLDVIRENHQFLWNEEDVDSWEKQLAKRYYDKLFKEYCIADLSRYKENKVNILRFIQTCDLLPIEKFISEIFIDLFPFQIALRWRIDREVITSKGQFICGNKKCDIRTELKSWEVNFAYMENGEKKNALVKLSNYLLILLNVPMRWRTKVYGYTNQNAKCRPSAKKLFKTRIGSMK